MNELVKSARVFLKQAVLFMNEAYRYGVRRRGIVNIFKAKLKAIFYDRACKVVFYFKTTLSLKCQCFIQ